MGIAKRVFLVILPGGALLLRRRYLLGALYFAGWVFLITARVLFSVLGLPLTGAANWLSTAAAAVFGMNCALALCYIYWERRAPRAEDMDETYGAALAAFAAGRDKEVLRILRKMLRRRALDPDCLFLWAQTALREGDKRRARRLFRKCRDFDEEGKWTWEVERALRQP
ncbi:MAG: tetratricopeptide repeat protein [Planctomycetota bacterium]|jgi:hypothetical protein